MSRKNWMIRIGILLGAALLTWGILVFRLFGKSDSYHKINYNLGDLEDVFIKTPANAKSGERVSVRTSVLYDADIHFFLDGEELNKSYAESDYWEWSFVMPDREVTITAKPYSKADMGEEISVFPLTPSDEGVSEFREMITPVEKRDIGCRSIFPQEIKDRYGFQAFKFDDYETCLVFEGSIYRLGEYVGGLGTTYFAVADLDGDGWQELYFTFSWGSGIHRSQIGYFDSAEKRVWIFDYSNMDYEMTFAAEAGVLEVRGAEIRQIYSPEMILLTESEKKIGTITLCDNYIMFESDSLKGE